jgi:predicted transcriptional regulator
MTTATIRLEDDLKARVAAAAEREGKTAPVLWRVTCFRTHLRVPGIA